MRRKTWRRAPVYFTARALEVAVWLLAAERIGGRLLGRDDVGGLYVSTRIRDIARDIGRSNSFVSVALAELAEAGVVDRCKLHNDPQRFGWQHAVSFTPHGRELVERVATAARAGNA